MHPRQKDVQHDQLRLQTKERDVDQYHNDEQRKDEWRWQDVCLQLCVHPLAADHTFNEQDRATDRSNARHHGDRCQRVQEPAVIAFADAIVQPLAMVVEDVSALVAVPAMLAPEGHTLLALHATETLLLALLDERRGLINDLGVAHHGLVTGADQSEDTQDEARSYDNLRQPIQQRHAHEHENHNVASEDDPTDQLQCVEWALESMAPHGLRARLCNHLALKNNRGSSVACGRAPGA
mmetsp:Transcript_44584/g.123539  ORF Transcript_44584/g.123539 Transcript_44584/m.123539 type:complete len:237 (-) Transcript_44584:63-773(-)